MIYRPIENIKEFLSDISPRGMGRNGLEISSVFISQNWLIEFEAAFKHKSDNSEINRGIIGGNPLEAITLIDRINVIIPKCVMGLVNSQ